MRLLPLSPDWGLSHHLLECLVPFLSSLETTEAKPRKHFLGWWNLPVLMPPGGKGVKVGWLQSGDRADISMCCQELPSCWWYQFMKRSHYIPHIIIFLI